MQRCWKTTIVHIGRTFRQVALLERSSLFLRCQSLFTSRIIDRLDGACTRMIARREETGGGDRSEKGWFRVEEILFIASSASSRALVLIDHISDDVANSVHPSILEELAIEGGSIARRYWRKQTRLFQHCFPSVSRTTWKRKWIFDDWWKNRGLEYRMQLWWTWMQSERSGRAISQKKRKERLKWFQYKRFFRREEQPDSDICRWF